MLRKIERVDLDGENVYWSGVGVDDDGMHEPTVEWGDPADLWVDEAYQREIRGTGLALIKRIAKNGWSWRKFKLPVVTVDGEGRRVVIDGQHTATAATSRGIKRMPWLLVKTVGMADQAEAFVGQNKDRTAVSKIQQHKALAASGDEVALTIDQVLGRAGVRLLPHINKEIGCKPGDTIALAAISTLINRRFAAGAGRVLRILRAAELAPITANHIKAVEALLFGDDFKGVIDEEKLTAALSGRAGAELELAGNMWAAQYRVSAWKGLVTKLFQVSRGRVRAD